MQSISTIPALLLMVGLTACTSLHRGSSALDAHAHFDDAVARYQRGDLAGAARQLAWVDRNCDGHDLGLQATLALAALRLDGRNPGRGVDDAARLADRFLRTAPTDDWRRPVAATLYLVARDLGAATRDSAGPPDDSAAAPAGGTAERVHGCGSLRPLPNDTAAPTLPVLPGEPLIARLRTVRAERDRLSAAADSLETALDSVRLELAAKDKELERIRKTLKP